MMTGEGFIVNCLVKSTSCLIKRVEHEIYDLIFVTKIAAICPNFEFR